MHARTAYLIGALFAFTLFMLTASILIYNEQNSPISRLTRFASIDWLDGKFTSVFPDSVLVKDLHRVVVSGAFHVHRYLEYEWNKIIFTVICIGLLLISIVCVALHFAQKSLDWHREEYFRRQWEQATMLLDRELE